MPGNTSKRYPPELKERAVRMFGEVRSGRARAPLRPGRRTRPAGRTPMRLALLYARSRGVLSAGVALLVLCGMGAAAGHWLATRTSLDPATARVPVMVALAVAVAVVLVGTLHSPADEIERTTPRRWAGWRTGHALAATAAGVLLTAPVLPATAYGQSSLLRNTAGLFGLALLSAVIFGPRLGWLLPVGYAATIYLSARLGQE